MKNLHINFLYGWTLRALLEVIITVSWIMGLTFTLAKFSLTTLPFLFLLQAAFMIIGMLLFSTITEHFGIQKLLVTALSGAALIALVLSSGVLPDKLYLILTLVVTGVLLPQVEVLFANLLEHYFKVQEATKVFPWFESAEMTGGVIGGLLAAGVGMLFQDSKILWIFILLSSIVFAVILRKFCLLKNISSHHSPSIHKRNFNAFFKAVSNIRHTPLLYTFMICLACNALLFHLLEFQYAQTIYNQVFHASTPGAMMQSLLETFGLFSFVIYGLTLILQAILARGLLKKLGAKGGFLIHALSTLLSSIAIMLIPGHAGILLARNNFEMTTPLRKNSYEVAYYDFEEGTQRSLREMFEAFITPCMTIMATLFMILMQNLLLPQHVSIILRICILFVAFTLTFFSFHLHFSKKIT